MTIKIMINTTVPIVIPAIAPGDSLSLDVLDPPTGANVGDGVVDSTGANVVGGIGGLILVIE